jgi:serine/threonine protein kinase
LEKPDPNNLDAFGPITELDFYKVGRVLGKGAYGKVNLAIHVISKKLCAVKSINVEYGRKHVNCLMKLKNEIFLLSYLRHPSVIKIFEEYETHDLKYDDDKDTRLNYSMFFMELCQGGDLLNYTRRRKFLDEGYAKYIMKEVMLGLGYIHSRMIIHKDIKLENILLDNHGAVKICDFGISELMTHEKAKCTKSAGTPVYMAPEVIEQDSKFMKDFMKEKPIHQEGFGFKCDVWSAGVCLYAMIYGTFPFKGSGLNFVKEDILKSEVHIKPTVKTGLEISKDC